MEPEHAGNMLWRTDGMRGKYNCGNGDAPHLKSE